MADEREAAEDVQREEAATSEDDVPLNKIYTSINKSLSSSTKLKKKPSDETFEPMYPSILERIGRCLK